MSFYQVVFVCSGLLVFPPAVIQVVMRRQVLDADCGIGNPELSPRDPRFVNGMFGTDSLIQCFSIIWSANRKFRFVTFSS